MYVNALIGLKKILGGKIKTSIDSVKSYSYKTYESFRHSPFLKARVLFVKLVMISLVEHLSVGSADWLVRC